MGKLKLFIGIYNSISPHMSEADIERIYGSSLKHYLTRIYNNKNIPLSLYYNGSLLNWMEKNHPEYISVLEELIQRRQVEILTGPYNEPILPIISVADRLGQLEKMTTFLRKLFNKRFRGCWLPGMIWESSLASNLNGAGINYTFLESEQFERSGIKDIYSPVMTEDQGRSIIVFPFHRILSDSAINAPVQHIMDSLKKIAGESQDDRMVTLMFHGENFATPEIHNWFEQFLQLADANKNWLDCYLPSNYVKEKESPWKRAYIGSSTYGDMKRYFQNKEQCLPLIDPPGENDSYRTILCNNSDQSFYIGRINYVALLINSVRGDKSRKKNARENLWRAQNIYSFWGGELAYQAKKSGFLNLIEAEKTTREKGIFNSSIIETDYDLDGQSEFIFQGLVYNGCVHLKGGTLFELDYLPSCWNYGFNRAGRKSFIDCFLTDDFNRDSYFERRSTLNGPGVYSYRQKDSTRDDKQIQLHGKIEVLDCEGNYTNIRMSKKYLFKRNWFVVSYIIENVSEWSREFNFGTEINLSLPEATQKSLDLSFVTSREKSDIKGYEVSNCASIMALDSKNSTDIQIDFGEDMDLWYYIDQETLTILPKKTFSLFPQEKKELRVSLKLGRHKA